MYFRVKLRPGEVFIPTSSRTQRAMTVEQDGEGRLTALALQNAKLLVS